MKLELVGVDEKSIHYYYLTKLCYFRGEITSQISLPSFISHLSDTRRNRTATPPTSWKSLGHGWILA